jgi:alpha-tubulin suppressor-like RCC1 family protein
MRTSSLLCAAILAAGIVLAQDGRITLALGGNHGVLLKADGTLWTWGLNTYGQLGREHDDTWEVAQIPGMSGIRSIAASEASTLILKADGTVWAWGLNREGELGNGTKGNNSPRPAPVPGLPPQIVAIAAASYQAMALDSNGNVWEWGAVVNSRPNLSPRQVEKLRNITAIAVGDEHNVAVDRDGNVWVWGYHGAGNLGDNCYDISYVPQRLPGLSDVVAVAAAYHTTAALKKDGTVWTIGYGAAGQLGNGTTVNFSTTPVRVTGLANVKAIAAHYMTLMALKSDGTVWGWGANHYRQLGNPEFGLEDYNKPVRAANLTDVAAIATAGSYSAAVTSKGVVWNWGQNDNGSLGADSELLDRSDVPMQPGEYIPPKCYQLFSCLTARGKVIRICGEPDESETGKFSGLHYRYGPESGPPELMFPEDPENAPPSLFFTQQDARHDWYMSIRFSTGPYTYRVYYGERAGGGVTVEDAKGKRLSVISCAERPEMYSEYLRMNLPCDSKGSQGKPCPSRP